MGKRVFHGVKSYSTWPLPYLFACPDREAGEEVLRRLRHDPAEALRQFTRLHLARYALHVLEGAGEAGEVRDRLRPAVAIELGWDAKRKLALAELDRFLEAKGVRGVLIKGAWTSLLFYPGESLRWSNDIDVILAPEDLRILYPREVAAVEARDYAFPRLHIARQVFAGTAVEMHYRFGYCRRWGSAADILHGATPAPGLGSLLSPAPEVGATVLLLHMLKDRGRAPYDLLDWRMLEASGALDWARAEALWREYGLGPFILPSLELAAEVTGGAPAALLDDLRASLLPAERRTAKTLGRYIRSERVTRLQTHRVRCELLERSFAGYCMDGFLGSRERTRRLTGMGPRHPLFWIWHLVILPCRRIFSFGARFLRSMEPH